MTTNHRDRYERAAREIHNRELQGPHNDIYRCHKCDELAEILRAHFPVREEQRPSAQTGANLHVHLLRMALDALKWMNPVQTKLIADIELATASPMPSGEEPTR